MIELVYAGHLGNNLFSYALARYLSEEFGHALSCRVAGSGPWGAIESRSGILDKLPDHAALFEDAPQERPGRVIQAPQFRLVLGEKMGWNSQSINLPYLLRAGRDCRVVLHGYFQRSEYYLPIADRIRRWYRMRPIQLAVKPGPRDVIVHVRRSLDMRLLDRRLDVSFYVNALEELRPDRVFVCGLGMDETLREALKPWRPEYLDLDAGRTLYLMTRFNRIVMANSTFSWWGAFLSEAERIVFPIPVRGLLSREQADIDLRVPEARYTYVEDAPLEPWRFLRCASGWSYTREMTSLVVQVPGLPPIQLQVSPGMEALLKYLATLPDAFGLHELTGAGFGTREDLAQVLIHLLQRGLLKECNRDANDPPLEQLLKSQTAFGVA